MIRDDSNRDLGDTINGRLLDISEEYLEMRGMLRKIQCALAVTEDKGGLTPTQCDALFFEIRRLRVFGPQKNRDRQVRTKK
jgi:hypothetical protein